MQLNSYLYPFMYIYFNDRCSCVAKMNNTLKVQMNDMHWKYKWMICWNYEWMIRWNYEWMICWKYKKNFHFWYDTTPHRIGLNTWNHSGHGNGKKRLLSLRIYRLWEMGTPGWGRGPMATPDYNVTSSLLTYL